MSQNTDNTSNKKVPDAVLRFKERQKQKKFNNEIINNSSVFEDHTNNDKTFKQFNKKDHRSYSDSRSNQFNNNRQKFNNEPRQFNNTRQKFNNEPRQFNNTRQNFNNEPRQFNNTRQKFNNSQQQFNNEPRQINNNRQKFNNSQQRFNNSHNRGQKPNYYPNLNIDNEDKWCSTNLDVQNDVKNLNTENFPSLVENCENKEFTNNNWKNIDNIKDDKGITKLWDLEKKNALIKKDLKEQKKQQIYEDRELRKLKIKQENAFHGDDFYDEDEDNDDEDYDDDL